MCFHSRSRPFRLFLFSFFELKLLCYFALRGSFFCWFWHCGFRLAVGFWHLRLFWIVLVVSPTDGRVTLCLQPQRVTRLILLGAKLNSCFIADLKGKTQDVFCKGPPLQLRPHRKHGGSHLVSTVIMLHQNSPTLKNTWAQTCWHRKLMITAPPKWLA